MEEEEGEERRQVRANEHSHRALRTIYNLQQQVREIERQMAPLPHDSRATKKVQVLSSASLLQFSITFGVGT